MMQQFKSMNELVEYLGKLEGRVRSLESDNQELVGYLGKQEGRLSALEEENQKLRALPAPTGTSNANVDERTIAKMVASFLPLTNIVHPSFLKRAFAVWGHYFVAQLIISIPFIILYFCLLSMVFSRLSQKP